MKILVTGSAGFVGHYISRELIYRGEEVIGVDNLSNYYSPLLKKYRNNQFIDFQNYKFIEGDISNREFVKKLFDSNKIDGIIHLAAQAGVRLKLSEMYKYTQSNLVGFENIVSKAIEKHTKFFIYASSSSVYGDSAKIPLKETELHLEPNSYYGATKLSNEICAKTLFKNIDTSVRGLRFFSVYGPMGRPDMAYFKLLICALYNLPFKLSGDGSIKRDFTYIDDVSGSIALLLDNMLKSENTTNDLVNVGGGKPMTMLELIQTAEIVSGKKIKVEFSPPNKNDSKITEADTSLQRSLISKTPNISLQEGIEKTYAWLVEAQKDLKFSEWI